MPIRSVSESPLPKHDEEAFINLRSAGACPIQFLDWYRLPQLFRLGQSLFGNSMMNPKSRSRRNIDESVKHACQVWKAKYPSGAHCTPERQAVCCALLERAFGEVRDSGIPAHPMMLFKLRQLVNSEWADEAIKKTVAPTKLDLGSIFKQEDEY
jgi:hypothetical protein